VQITHLETASAFSETGAKGMGEGGMIGAPAAVLNAINDALRPAGVSFDHIPVLPAEVCAAMLGDDVLAGDAAPAAQQNKRGAA
jgi:carbon-monoxide dehydrogenase large subunit